MEIPEVKDYKPRKSLGDEVIEQEVYGIDPYTHNLLLDSMPEESDWSLVDKHIFIEEVLLRTLNKQVRNFTGSGNTPMMYPLKPVFEEILENAEKNNDRRTMRLCQFILKAIDSRPEDNYVAYRKGLGVVCNKEGGFSEDDFVVEFLGEVYPTWKWFEKQDGIRALQKNNNDPAPEFYNIYLERPKLRKSQHPWLNGTTLPYQGEVLRTQGDADGYDLVVVDAMHKANYASRICHSCRPNCEAKVTAVDGQYQIGIYSVRPISYGEEITFDYNSVTEVCRGSYLNLTGEGAFQKVLKEHHGLLDRHCLLEACELNSVSEEDYIELGKAGLGSCLLGGLPDWLIAYTARLVRFINFERTKLPNEILRHNIEEKKRYFAEIHMEVEQSDAEIQAEGVYNQRLQNLALTIDKVRYVMRCVFGDPKKAPPPLQRLSPEEAVSYLWKGRGVIGGGTYPVHGSSYGGCHFERPQGQVHAHDPSGYDDTEMSYGNLYCGVHEYCKTYNETYCLGQLMFWHNQNAEPDATLAKASRGCLSLPDVGSFYAKVQKSRQRVYGPRTVKFMLARMVSSACTLLFCCCVFGMTGEAAQRPWPKDRIWSFKSSMKVVGSPMLDAVLHKATSTKNGTLVKHRPPIYQAMWDS
ncbi:UNVERIFIED_CONTAM: Histone-lysine N-methyltransferase ATXR3 [Sesamum radiatum]|uniref:Histone-lysine N-methyltransferase ATXR3 n=1 Tax=Sesamum radiatum TaxID=300843 RepID=A0AAW2KJE7_SESRA